MRSVDFLVQTVLLLMAVVMGLMGLNDHGAWMYVLVAQSLIGFWQYVGGIAWLTAYPKIKARQRHMALSTVYLIVLFIATGYSNNLRDRFPEWLSIGYVFVLPWVLAIYYYVITWRSTFQKPSKLSKFLPHTSF